VAGPGVGAWRDHGDARPAPAVVAEPGPAWGATIADRRVPYFGRAGEGSEQELPEGFSPWRVALGVDVARFRAEVRVLFGG
jgi:hypothetical protein